MFYLCKIANLRKIAQIQLYTYITYIKYTGLFLYRSICTET